MCLFLFPAASTLPRSLPNQAPRGEGAGREKQAPGDNYATIRRPEAKVISPSLKQNLSLFCKTIGSRKSIHPLN